MKYTAEKEWEGCPGVIPSRARQFFPVPLYFDPSNPPYPIEPHTPSNIYEKIQDVFLDFQTTEKTLVAVDFYKIISNFNMLTEIATQEEKGQAVSYVWLAPLF